MSASSSSAADQGASQINVVELPDAVWYTILSNLKQRHLAAVRGTCRRLREMSNSVTKKVKVDPSAADSALDWELHQSFPVMETLEMMKPCAVDFFTNEMLTELALQDLGKMQQLKCLNLQNLTGLTVSGLAGTILACPRLESLTLPKVQAYVEKSFLWVMSCRLPVICQYCKTDTILKVLHKLPSLRKLRLKFCQHCVDGTLDHLADATALTALELEDYGQCMKEVHKLTGLTNLQSIMIWSDLAMDVAHMVNELLVIGAQHHAAGGPIPPHLHPAVVHVGGMPPPLPAGFPIPPGMPIPAGMAIPAGPAPGPVHGPVPGAEGPGAAWDMDDVEDMDDVADMLDQQLHLVDHILNTNLNAGHSNAREQLLTWVSGMTSLTHVDMQRVELTDAELKYFTSLKSLQHLGLGDVAFNSRPDVQLTSVTKLVVHSVQNEQHLPPTFPCLKALSCDAGDEGLRDISVLTGLVNLFLWQSPSDKITDKGLGHVSSITGMDTFRLEGASGVTTTGWVEFARHHPSLTKIDLINVPGITAVGVIMSLPYLRKLRKISFVDCPALDTSALAALISFCPDLDHVELQDCSGVSQGRIREVLREVGHRPDLEVVWRLMGASKVLTTDMIRAPPRGMAGSRNSSSGSMV